MSGYSRRVFVGPHAVGFIAGMQKAANLDIMLAKLPELPLRDLIYLQLVQSGASVIYLPSHLSLDVPTDTYLKRRVAACDSRAHERTISRIRSALNDVSLDEEAAKTSAFTKIVYLIIDVALALETGDVPVMVEELPTERELDETLTPGAAIAVAGLLRVIRDESGAIHLPRLALPKRDASFFEEVLQSDLFSKYRRSHVRLQEAQYPAAESLRVIESDARALQRRFSDRIELSNVLVPMLDVSTRIVDAVFGKLPGKLAEMLGSAATRFIENRKRVVLVYAGPALVQLFRRRLEQYNATAGESDG